MIIIGDIYIYFSDIKKIQQNKGSSLWSVKIHIKSDNYSIKSTFEVTSEENPIEELINIGEDNKVAGYKSYCEHFLFTKTNSKKENWSISIDLCIDSYDFDSTNRSVITSELEMSDINLQEQELRQLFSKIK